MDKMIRCIVWMMTCNGATRLQSLHRELACMCIYGGAGGGAAKFMMNSSYQSSPDFKDFLFCRACVLRLTGLSGAEYLQSGSQQESTVHGSTFTLHYPHQTALTQVRQVRLFKNEHISMERHSEKTLQNTHHSILSFEDYWHTCFILPHDI